MTSDDDAMRVTVSSSHTDIATTFTGLRPNTLYNVTVAVTTRYGLGPPLSAAAATAREF